MQKNASNLSKLMIKIIVKNYEAFFIMTCSLNISLCDTRMRIFFSFKNIYLNI